MQRGSVKRLEFAAGTSGILVTDVVKQMVNGKEEFEDQGTGRTEGVRGARAGFGGAAGADVTPPATEPAPISHCVRLAKSESPRPTPAR